MLHINRKRGFTILELLLVLVIIAFFAAMVLPRLGGVFGDAHIKIRNNNIREIAKEIRIWQQERNGLPNKLINLVNRTDADYVLPQIEDEDEETGAETMPKSFYQSLKPYIHTLSAAEADELQKMGVTYLMTLNDRIGSYGTSMPENSTPMKQEPVAVGLKVMMIGAGYDNAGTWTEGIANGFSSYDADTGIAGVNGDGPGLGSTGMDHGHPEWMYRIVVGFGPDNSVVKDGTMEAAPICPESMKRLQHITQQYYVIVLPRLKATVTQVNNDNMPTLLTVVGEDEDRRDVTIGETQQEWEFAVVSPSGVNPAAKSAMWHIENVQ